MCGIVGYVGQSNAKTIVLKGLSRLEYRGYDSAGISLFDVKSGEFFLYKDIGRIKHLESLVREVEASPVGIGHTRWATHGRVTKENAHPHTSACGRFILVHNGVIDNYKSLNNLYLDSVTLQSQTDTEILVNVIAHHAKTMSTHEAINKTIEQVVGSYAILVIDKENPKAIYAAKNKSPLLLGRGGSGSVFGSDMMALVGTADMYYALEDETVIEATEEAYTVFDIKGKKKDITMQAIDIDDFLSDKGDHDHYMLKEIKEQPSVIRRIITKYNVNGKAKIDNAILQALKDADRVYILAAGTSMHSGLVGKELLEKLARIPVEVHIASEFAYHEPLLTEKPLFIMVSQSGETADLRACLVNLKAKKHRVLTITNVRTSTLAREANFFLEIFAGPEIAVASTKAYTAQVAVLAILAQAMSDADFDVRKELSQVAQAMDNVLADYGRFEALVRDFFTKEHAFYIGRGLDYFTCLEAALKLKEISYIHTEGFAAGELKHGTIALIEEDTPVIALISSQSIAHNTRSNLNEVESRGARTMVISTESVSEEGDAIVLNDVHPLLTPLITTIPTQLIAYYAALVRGFDIDKPRNLAKSVTVE